MLNPFDSLDVFGRPGLGFQCLECYEAFGTAVVLLNLLVMVEAED